MFSVLSIRKRAQFEYIFHFTEKESGSQMKNKIITLYTNDIYRQQIDILIISKKQRSMIIYMNEKATLNGVS